MFIVLKGPKVPHSFRSAMWNRRFQFELPEKQSTFSSSQVAMEHRTPKGVQPAGKRGDYKHSTPPE